MGGDTDPILTGDTRTNSIKNLGNNSYTYAGADINTTADTDVTNIKIPQTIADSDTIIVPRHQIYNNQEIANTSPMDPKDKGVFDEASAIVHPAKGSGFKKGTPEYNTLMNDFVVNDWKVSQTNAGKNVMPKPIGNHYMSLKEQNALAIARANYKHPEFEGNIPTEYMATNNPDYATNLEYLRTIDEKLDRKSKDFGEKVYPITESKTPNT